MIRKTIMTVSALALGIAGVAATFLPQEILQKAGVPAAGALPLLVQITGALYLSFAMMNWMAKDSLIGGIYNRPLAIGNLLHFVMGTLALGKGGLYAVAVVYGIFAVAFTYIVFTSPVQRAASDIP
jgi:hypothetical protein